MMTRFAWVGWVTGATLVLLVAGCAKSTTDRAIDGISVKRAVDALPHEDLDAALWMRTSAEYHAICLQTYAVATRNLELALKDPTWSAIPSQALALTRTPPDGPSLPPAVILDVDETVLDNSPYQVTQIDAQGEYEPKTWEAWAQRGAAAPMAGVADFVNACRRMNVAVFYVTNRTIHQERATVRNLLEHHLLEEDVVDHVLTKEERDDWVTDKESRRQFLAARYRVLLVLGDDLNDFASTGNKPSSAARLEVCEQHKHLWGNRWLMLPNANYGGWERSLYGFDDSVPHAEKLKIKRKRLHDGPVFTPEAASAPSTSDPAIPITPMSGG